TLDPKGIRAEHHDMAGIGLAVLRIIDLAVPSVSPVGFHVDQNGGPYHCLPALGRIGIVFILAWPGRARQFSAPPVVAWRNPNHGGTLRDQPIAGRARS